MNKALVPLLGLLLATGCTTQRNWTVHVAPNGSDTIGNGSSSAPFASIARAQTFVRESGKLGKEPIDVVFGGGLYTVREPIVFSAADSGAENAVVSYRACSGETPVFSGGEKLVGSWKQSPGKPYWQMSVPESFAATNFFSLYVNGQSRTRARFPNWNEKVLRGQREPGGDPRQALRYSSADVDPAWTNPTDIDVVLLCSWTPTIHRVKEIDAGRKAVRFFSSHVRAVDAWEKNFRYYLSNVFEALDEPGEWYFNRHTHTLYYYPLPDEDLAAAEIIVPMMRSRIVTMNGLHNAAFEGLAFSHVDGDMDRYNGMYRQGHMYLDSAIRGINLKEVSFIGCEFSHLGEYAVELADGCRNVTLRKCHLWDLGAGALQLGVSDLGAAKKGGAEVEVRNLVIDNNCIHRTGTIWHGCYGIVNRFAFDTQITHNDIYDIHYTAIGLDARWDWNQEGKVYSSGNVVAYNHLHDLGLGYHTDGAGIYQFGPLNTKMEYNHIHNAAAYPYICGYAGIYLDEQSRAADVENNLVYDVAWYAYFQHKGVDNIFRNNIGGFARNGLFGRGGLNDRWKTNDMLVCRNIYVTDNAIAIGNDWQAGLRKPVVCSNLYFTVVATNLTFDGKSPADWLAQGLETNVVIGDPGFVDCAKRDFTLPPDSAAEKLIGFHPFNREIRKAGLYGEQSWTSLPERYPPRTRTPQWTEEDLLKLASFEMDLNLLKPGDVPFGMVMSDQKDAGFVITDEVKGLRGPNSIRCTDRKELARSWQPNMTVSPRIKKGKVLFTFAARMPATNAAPFTVEFRGKGQTKDVGPVLLISTDGSVRADRKEVCRLTPDEWTGFRISFTLGEGNTGMYNLEIRNREGARTLDLPFRSTTFDQLAWLSIMAHANTNGCFYLDNISLKVND